MTFLSVLISREETEGERAEQSLGGELVTSLPLRASKEGMGTQ